MIEGMKDVLAERYASSDMKAIWSPESKVLEERKFWISLLRAQARSGVLIPELEIEKYAQVAADINLDSIRKRESVLLHDVKARIEEFNALAGSQLIHLGMTSRDLTENIELLQIKKSLELLQKNYLGLTFLLNQKAVKHSSQLLVARSHNIPAQLTTLGKRFSIFVEEMLFSFERLSNLIERLPLRGIRGPVGTASDMIEIVGSDYFRALEDSMVQELGFNRVLDSTGQIYPRSVDFEILSTLVQLASGPSSFSTTLRLMSGHGLANEGFAENQVGSSAMPHKMNPRSSERINGLIKVLRGFLTMVSETTGDQWNEGDVSCSVVRRVAIPGAFFAIDGVVQTLASVINGLIVSEDILSREVDSELPFLASSKLMLAAVTKGLGREDAHRLVKGHAVSALQSAESSRGSRFIRGLADDPSFPMNELEIDSIVQRERTLVGEAMEQVKRVDSKVKILTKKYPYSVNFESII